MNDQHKYTYALQDQTHCDVLSVGKNVIGRSSAPVEGVSFVNINSDRAAISRMQAFIEIAPNGDAWICDCNSTNGTLLTIRGGVGIRLEPQHYYQLSPNAMITFADVERRFVVLENDSNRNGAAIAPSTIENDRNFDWNRNPVGVVTGQSGVNAEASTSKPAHAGILKENRNKQSSPRARSPREVPYLAEVPNTKRETPKATKTNKSTERDAQSRKRARSLTVEEKKVTPKRVKSTTPTARESQTKKGVFVACVSGMNSKQRGIAQKALNAHNGRIVEDISKAGLLIVPTPATRTPKFIIAVGRGIPIIDIEHLEEALKNAEIGKYIVSLNHLGMNYSSEMLRSAIFRKREIPLLKGLKYHLGGLSVKQRSTVQDIIIGCEGKVTSHKGASVTEITDENLNIFYDSILRGQRPLSTI